MKTINLQTNLLLIILALQTLFILISYDNRVPLSLDNILTLTGLILTVAGWFAVYYFGFRQSKNKINLDRKIIIYDRLTELKQSLDDAFVFDLMAYVGYFKIFEIALDNPAKELLDYSKQLGENSYNAHKAFQKFDNCVRAWIFLMPNLEEVEVVAAKEFDAYLKKVDLLKEAVSAYALSFASDEKVQKRQFIEKVIGDIDKDTSNIVNFLDDLMELISDELAFPVFSYRIRRGIENLEEGQLYKKLTITGIKEVPYELKDFQKS